MSTRNPNPPEPINPDTSKGDDELKQFKFTLAMRQAIDEAIFAICREEKADRDPVSFRAEVIGMRKAEMNAILARAIERGEVRADVPVELVRELGQSVLWHRLLISGDPITDDVVIQLVGFDLPRSSCSVRSGSRYSNCPTSSMLCLTHACAFSAENRRCSTQLIGDNTAERTPRSITVT